MLSSKTTSWPHSNPKKEDRPLVRRCMSRDLIWIELLAVKLYYVHMQHIAYSYSNSIYISPIKNQKARALLPWYSRWCSLHISMCPTLMYLGCCTFSCCINWEEHDWQMAQPLTLTGTGIGLIWCWRVLALQIWPFSLSLLPVLWLLKRGRWEKVMAWSIPFPLGKKTRTRNHGAYLDIPTIYLNGVLLQGDGIMYTPFSVAWKVWTVDMQCQKEVVVSLAAA